MKSTINQTTIPKYKLSMAIVKVYWLSEAAEIRF